MKIFATTDKKSLINTYMGKDIWVKCEDTYTHKKSYIRFINWLPSDAVYVNYLSAVILMDIHPERVREQMRSGVRMYTQHFNICEPPQTLTTEQICHVTGIKSPPDYSNIISVLSDFIGDELWIKVYSHSFNDYRYVRILDIKDNIVKYNSVGVEYVDDYDAGLFEDLESMMYYPHTSHIDSWDIVEPMEVVSTDEMLDIFKHCEDNLWAD
jgi:hypothetical protein